MAFDEPLLVTTKVVGPEASLSAAGSQPALVIATWTVLPAPPALATAVLVSLSPPSVPTSSTDRRRDDGDAGDRGAHARAHRVGSEDDGEHRNRVEQPAHDLDHRRLGMDPEDAGDERLPDRAGADDGAQVQRLRLAADDPAGLRRRVQRGGDEARGHQDEHDARGTEEAREVQPQAAAVDPEAERDGGGQAEHDAQAGGHRVGRVVEGGEQEDRGLEALAQHREEGHCHEGQGRALGQRAGRLILQLALEIARMLGHPHDHVGDHRHRHERDDGLEALLLAVRKLVVDDPQYDGHGDAQRDGQADPQPHGAQRIATLLAAQEGGDDPHDQRGLEALAQGDHERRQHVNLRVSRLGGPNCD